MYIDGMSSRRRSVWKLLLLIAFLVAAVVLYQFTPLGEYVTIPRIRAAIEELHPATSRLAYVGLYLVGTVLLVPGVVLSFVGAALFGPYEGTLYTWIGATIGATLCFLLAKALGREFVESLLGGRLAALDQRLRDHGFVGMLIIRLVPLFPFNGVNFGSGLTAIRFRDYVLATAIGILPATFIYQFLFARVQEKIAGEGVTWSDWLDPILFLALGLFLVLILVGKWTADWLSRKDREKQETAP